MQTSASVPQSLPYSTSTRDALEIDVGAWIEWGQACPAPTGGKTSRPVFLLGFAQTKKAKSIQAAVARTGKLIHAGDGQVLELLRTLDYESSIQVVDEGVSAITWILPHLFLDRPVNTKLEDDAEICFITMPPRFYLWNDWQARAEIWKEVIAAHRKGFDTLTWNALASVGEELIGPLCAYWCMSLYHTVSTPLLQDPHFQVELFQAFLKSRHVQVDTEMRGQAPRVFGVAAYGYMTPLFTRGLASKMEAVIANVLRNFGSRITDR